MRLELPDNVKYIIEKLNNSGYSAYAVGGCVRDSIMGRIPSDWDICTDAIPEKTLSCLNKPNIIDNGMKHGTVTVRYDGENYEITTFRSDGEYIDNRRPESVTFVRDIKEDLARRDFTINAIAYNEKEGIIDPYSGYDDIQKMIIRCVGDPDCRFNEDALRIMRALRFSSVLGFKIDPGTSESIHKNAHLLVNISAERIMSEFCKMLTGKDVERILRDYADVIGVFIPEILPMIGFEQNNKHHIYDVWTHTVKVVSAIRPEKNLRLAAFLHDIGKPDRYTTDKNGTGHFHGHPELSAELSREILNRLKADNNSKHTICVLIKYHDVRPVTEPKYVRRLIAKTGKELFPLLIELKRADAIGQNPVTIGEKLDYLFRLEEIYNEEIKNKTAFTVRDLKINGRDVIDSGITDGEKIGRCLDHILNMVIDGEIRNDREELLAVLNGKKLN